MAVFVDENIRKIVNDFVDARIYDVAQKTYASLLQVDRRVSFEEIAARVRRDFNRSYAMISAVDEFFGRQRCEAERAAALLDVIERLSILNYSSDIEMCTH